MTDDERKERDFRWYLAGQIDSGCTIDFIKIGKKKKEVPVFRMRRPDDRLFLEVRRLWGGTIVKRGKAFELTLTYKKAIMFLRYIRGTVYFRRKDIDAVLKRYDEMEELKQNTDEKD